MQYWIDIFVRLDLRGSAPLLHITTLTTERNLIEMLIAEVSGRGVQGMRDPLTDDGNVQTYCKDRLQFKGFISLLAKLSNNIDVFVIF